MGSVTVKVRSALLAAVAAVAVLAAYVLGGAAQGTASPATASAPAAQAAEKTRSIQVVGKGTATVVPDQLAFTVAVTAKRTTLDEALAAANATTRRALDALADHGVTRGDTQTTGLSMNPEYYYPSSGPPVLTGYRVSQRVRVQVQELADGGAAISAAVGAGDGVRVGSVQLVVGDPEAAIAEARDAAIQEAKAKAQQYAEASGATLGEVASVREVSAPPARRDWAAKQLSAYRFSADAASVPIRAGESDLTVRVQVVWSLG